MSNPLRGALQAAAAALALTLTLTACSSDEPSGSRATTSSSPSTAAESSAAPVADGPFGAGCSAVPAAGEGSIAGMADDPLVTAASHNPLLSGLVSAVTKASLADSLDRQQNITVLAPVNAAFEAVPADQLKALLADSPELTSVLLHHVIHGRLTPADLAGTHTTLNDDEITIEGSGESFTVADEGTLTATAASVICGNVQTATATVYLIDQVLAPAAQ